MFRRMTWRRALGSRALAAIAVVSTATACFDPKIPACLSCPTGECPSGQRCIQGRCAARGQSCASQTPETCTDGRCCISGSCFDLNGATPVAWLDWTSLRPANAAPNTSLERWFDRSGLAHDGHPMNEPVIGPGALGATPVLRMRNGDEFVFLGQPPLSKLRQVGSRDFLVLVAALMYCDVTRSNFCFAQKSGELYDADGGGMPQGFFLRALSQDQAMAVFMNNRLVWSARSAGLGLGCEKFHLFGIRRVAGDAGQLQLRVDGSVAGSVDLPAHVDGATSVTYFLGNSSPCGPFTGEFAASVVIDGPVSDAQTCALEQFLMARLADAGLMDAGVGPACR
jgi:hypothetical protein